MLKPKLFASSAILLVFAVDPVSAQSSTETYTYDVHGRLVVSETAGGQNDDQTHSYCYDESGNRTEYKAASDGTESACVEDGTGTGGGGGGGGTPPPPPPPPPSNNPPVTTPDFVSGPCFLVVTVNLTANDSDPEGNLPLTLTGITKTNGGQAGATIVSASSVSVDFGPNGDFAHFTYTVEDSLGASSTGELNVSSSCSGGGGLPF